MKDKEEKCWMWLVHLKNDTDGEENNRRQCCAIGMKRFLKIAWEIKSRISWRKGRKT